MRALKKYLLLPAFLMLVLQAFSNFAEAQEPPPSNLYGTVVADSTMEPLGDVEVRIQGTEKVASTDEQGRFSFDTLEPGTYTVVVQVPGYKPWSKEVKATNEGKELRIVLEREDREG